MRMVDLFSGIGGFSLAATWVWGDSLDIACFCERDEFCQQVLNKHWPNVPIVGDVYDTESIVAHAKGDKVPNQFTPLKDYSDAVAMYEDGISVGEIAGKYEITRQAMWKILKRRGVKFRPNLRYGKDNHFYRGTQAHDHSQNIVENAVDKGRLEPQPCEVCGADGTFKDGRREVQAHHDDYNKPLEVRWLCQKHHHEWHMNNKPIPKREKLDASTESESIGNNIREYREVPQAKG